MDPAAGAPVQIYRVQVGGYADSDEAEQVVAPPQEGRTVPALDFCASAPLRRAARAQLSEVRPSGLRVDGADAAAGAVRAIARRRRSRRRAFVLGLLTGVVYFAGTLYWLVETMTTFGGLATPVASFAAALLVAYLSLFPARSPLILARLRRTFGRPAARSSARPVWVATELGRQLRAGTAFPGRCSATAR